MDIKKNQISILNKIKFKPLLVEKIFSYSLNRPYPLFYIISNDLILKNRLNSIFKNIKQNKNKLNNEYNTNLFNLLLIKEILLQLIQWLNEKKIQSISYNLIKYELKYSYIQYIYDLAINYFIKHENFVLNKNIIKSIIFDYCGLLDNFVITLFPNDSTYLDYSYISFIEELNSKSKSKNKINQNIKLILIFDEYKYYNKILKEIKYKNITEIIVIFDDENLNKKELLKNFDNYLSHIKHLENINKIIFINRTNNNYLINNNNNIKINNENYQSLLNYFFDNLYIEKDIKYIFKLIKNIEDIRVETIGYIYIYEKIKLYYFINEVFHSLKSNILNKDNNIQYYIYNKLLIIKNKNNPLKIYDLLINISNYLNNNNLEYLFIINNNSLIYDEQENYNNIKFINNNLKEFVYINNQESKNVKKLIEYLSFLYNNIEYNIYEGYDEKNNLIFFRKGKTYIQSFDLINLFNYNKILTKIKLINEKININYNKERTKLEIINIEEIKNEINSIIDNNLNLNHFTQFIYNQINLKELKINRFDFRFKDIANNNINILNINYENNPLIMKYKLLEHNLKIDINKLFPNLTVLNYGGDYMDLINNIQLKDCSKKLKIIKILSKPIKKKIISKIKKKYNKYKKEFIYEFINNLNLNDDEEEEIEDEDYYMGEELSKYDDYPIFIKQPENYKNSSDCHPCARKYLPRLYYMDFIHDLKERKFIKEFNKMNESKLYIFYKSNILKNYSMKSKILNKIKNNFYVSSVSSDHNIKEVKLLYTFKNNYERLLNLADELKNEIKYHVVIKMDCDLYFFGIFFKTDAYSYYKYSNYIHIYKNSGIVRIGDSMKLEGSFSEGTFLHDIKINDSIIYKGTKFKVLQLEIFGLTIPGYYSNIKNNFGHFEEVNGVFYSGSIFN